MSSAGEFGYKILSAGRGATFAKNDLSNAFKIIPGHPSQWRLFGFSWLGKFFYDVTTVFGSVSEPANFDGLPETLSNIMSVLDQVPIKWIFRQLDDLPFVSAAGSGCTEKFTDAYTKLCRKLNVPLADLCPNHEKAFGPGCTSTVLSSVVEPEPALWHFFAGAGKKTRLRLHT